MNPRPSAHHPSHRLFGSLLAAALLLPAAPLLGQTFANPDFEANTFSGAVSSNAPIAGWTTPTPALVGLNQFNDNGTAPGGNVAFLQTGGVLKTVVTGLAPGTKYHVSFAANSSSASTAYLTFSTDAAASTQSAKIAPVGGTAAYRTVAYEFTATGTSQEITLANTRETGAYNLLIDSFTIAAASGAWSTVQWTGDENCGIDSQYAYTHAIDFAETNPVTINGVPFIGSNTNNVQVTGSLGSGEVEYTVPGRISIQGLGATAGFGTVGVTGNSGTMARNFRAGNLTITLTNLKPSTSYVASIFGAGWDQPTTEDRYRAATFSSSVSSEKYTVDLDQFGYANGVAVNYGYTSDAQGSVVLSLTGLGTNLWHTGGFCNREAAPDTGETAWTLNEWNDDASSGLDGTYRYTHALNFAGTTETVVNGVRFTNLAGNNPSAENFTSYRLQGAGGVNDSVTNITGLSNGLTSYFHWAFTPDVMTLSGLTPGEKYVFSLFSIGWDAQRSLLFLGTAGGKAMTINQGVFGVDNGLHMDYTYVAPPSGTVVIAVSGFSSNSAGHIYAIANREAQPMADVAPVITLQPKAATIAAGNGYTLYVGASGSGPLSYQWKRNGIAIGGATQPTYTIAAASPATDAGSYTCTVTNSAVPGGVTTDAVAVVVRDAVPGLFGTGLGWDHQLLPDRAVDPHYFFAANPNGNGTDVIASTANGAWLSNTAASRWVGPQYSNGNSAAARFPDYYIYRTQFHLNHFDLSSVILTGKWASDNEGIEIQVNGVSVNFPNLTSQFSAFVPFTIDAAVLAENGATLYADQVNTLDFIVANGAIGDTGLMVRDLAGTGVMLPNSAPVISVQPASVAGDIGDTVTLGVVASGTGPLSYQWKHNGMNVGPAGSQPFLALTLADSSSFGDYTVVVSSPVLPGGVESQPATVGLPGLATYEVTTEKNVPLQIDTFEMMFLIGAEYSFVSQDATSAAGGTLIYDGESFITYTPPTGFAGADSFNYIVSGAGGNRTARVDITVTGVPDVGTSPGRLSLAVNLAAGTVTGTFTGTPAASYTLQRSTTLEAGSWQDVGTATASGAGAVTITDSSPPAGRAFYRISY